MYEGFFLVVLTALVILFMRPGKKVIYDNPVVIDKAPLYHATLAPQLIRAQPFLETVASLFYGAGLPKGDIATQYFQVSDAEGCYLLAAGYRAGMVYFQAIESSIPALDYRAINQFSDAVLENIPIDISADIRVAEQLRAAVDVAAIQLQITCKGLNAECGARNPESFTQKQGL